MKSHEITQEELEQIDINDWIKNHEVHKDRLTPAIIITAVVICSAVSYTHLRAHEDVEESRMPSSA